MRYKNVQKFSFALWIYNEKSKKCHKSFKTKKGFIFILWGGLKNFTFISQLYYTYNIYTYIHTYIHTYYT